MISYDPILSYIIPYLYELMFIYIHYTCPVKAPAALTEARCRRHRGDVKPKGWGANPNGSREKPSAFGWKYVGSFSRKKFP